jgi:hypothetical protein
MRRTLGDHLLEGRLLLGTQVVALQQSFDHGDVTLPCRAMRFGPSTLAAPTGSTFRVPRDPIETSVSFVAWSKIFFHAAALHDRSSYSEIIAFIASIVLSVLAVAVVTAAALRSRRVQDSTQRPRAAHICSCRDRHRAQHLPTQNAAMPACIVRARSPPLLAASVLRPARSRAG